MPNRDIDNYIASLDYNPQVLLAVVPDGSTSTIPVKDRQLTNNGVIICTKTRHTLNKNLSEVAVLSPTAGVVFPGALVLADQNLSEGRPTPIALLARRRDPDDRFAGTGRSRRDPCSDRFLGAAIHQHEARGVE